MDETQKPPVQEANALDGQLRPTFFAVLIGIDNYPQKPLKSCVNDARGIQGRLLDRVNTNETNLCITTLTSCGHDGRGAAPLDDGDEEPATYDRILASLQKVIQAAKHDDFVYIHFSGHGTHLPPGTSSSRNNTGDTALVVPRDSEDGVRYLRGWKLAKMIRDMVGNTNGDRRAQVVLVLDCCYSGSVMRHKPENDVVDARYLPYDYQVDEAFPPSSEELAEEEREARLGSIVRTASVLPGWINNPQGYCVLAACGPHELALNIGGRSLLSYGAFSYHLIEAFRIQELQSFRQIFNHVVQLSKQLQAKHQPIPKQNPMWYGYIDRLFLGPRTSEQNAPAFSVVVQNSQDEVIFRLEAGRAHGVCEGDIFDILSRGLQRPVTSARAVQVGGLSSALVLEKMGAVRRGEAIFAVPSTKHVFCDYPTAVSTTHLAADEVQSWRDLQNRRPWLKISNGDPVEHMLWTFRISRSPLWPRYEIRDSNTSEIIVGSELDAAATLGLVEKIAMWRFVWFLRNNSPDSIPQSHYSVRLKSLEDPQKSVPPGSTLSVRDNSKIEIFIENLHEQILYIHIYRLGNGWEIQSMLNSTYVLLYPRMFAQQAERDFETPYEKKSRKPFKILMTVLEGDKCEDLFKIFLTESPTSFDALVSSRFGQEATAEGSDLRAGYRASDLIADFQDKWSVADFKVEVSR